VSEVVERREDLLVGKITGDPEDNHRIAGIGWSRDRLADRHSVSPFGGDGRSALQRYPP
jgi:hypothetical protein